MLENRGSHPQSRQCIAKCEYAVPCNEPWLVGGSASPCLPNIGVLARERDHVHRAFYTVDEFNAVLDVAAVRIRSLLFAFLSIHNGLVWPSLLRAEENTFTPYLDATRLRPCDML